MTFLKRHWFGFILSLFVSWFVLIFALVLLSPKQDLQKRGFVGCTETLDQNLRLCDGSMCLLKNISKNALCDSSVVLKGFTDWITGNTKTPWQNYLFEPEIKNNILDQGMEDFYAENKNLQQEMVNIKRLNMELENGKK